jgi:enoyl-CoA hydratase
MAYQTAIYTPKDHIAFITLNRPGNGNYVDLQMEQELQEISLMINQDDAVYLVVVTGAGDVFCRGADTGQSDEEAGILSIPGAAESIAAINRPVIVAINGDALGEGLEIALAGDIRLAAEKARFGLPQITQQLIPADGGTQRLPRIIGKGQALEMILTGETIDAGNAFKIGLVNKVVPAVELAAETNNLAISLAGKAPIAMRYLKEVVNQGLDLTLEQGLHLEADLYFLLHTTSDRTEGIASFMQKKQPHYEGK